MTRKHRHVPWARREDAAAIAEITAAVSAPVDEHDVTAREIAARWTHAAYSLRVAEEIADAIRTAVTAALASVELEGRKSRKK
jgi:hypothetical protein